MPRGLPAIESGSTWPGPKSEPIGRNRNNNVIELNDLTSACKMSRSNHSSITSSIASLEAQMNISGSTKTLNYSCPSLEIDNELINLLTLNNHRAGKSLNRPKNYLRILPPAPTKAVEELESSDKSALLGKANFSTTN